MPSRFYTATAVYGVDGAKITMTGSTVERCQNGVFPQTTGSYYPVFNLVNNSIIDNTRGVYVLAYNSGNRTYPVVTANYNDIHTNTDWNVYIGSGANPSTTELNFRNNYWKLADSASVKSKIYDYSNSTSSAKALFIPFATSPQGLYSIADINRDGHTDGMDLAILATSFGLYTIDQGFNPAADLNTSGRVDGFDLAILGINFGTWGHGVTTKGLPEYTDGQKVNFIADATYSSLEEGEEIRYIITAENTESVYAFGLDVVFDNSVMELVRIEDGGLLSKGFSNKVVLLHNIKYNSLYTAISRVGSPADLNENSGEVLVLTFKLKTSVASVPGIKLENIAATDWSGSRAMATTLDNRVNLDKDTPDRFLMIYPNPLSGIGTIEYFVPNEIDNVNISLYDSEGRLIQVLVNTVIGQGFHIKSFDVSDMASGIYTCVLKQGESVHRSRVVVLN